MNTHHHILSVKHCSIIFGTLLIFTLLTVAAAHMDFGYFNFPLAMLIATIKASLVVFYFMGLKFDSTENRVIFFSSFIFLAIFIVLISSDVLFRKADVYVPHNEIFNAKKFSSEEVPHD